MRPSKYRKPVKQREYKSEYPKNVRLVSELIARGEVFRFVPKLVYEPLLDPRKRKREREKERERDKKREREGRRGRKRGRNKERTITEETEMDE